MATSQLTVDQSLQNLSWGSLSLPNTPLFGTDGIRGRVGEMLTAPLALQVGFWAGQVLQAQSLIPGPVILGQDSRSSSDMLASALAAGLAATGLEVWQLGLCPTPAVAHLTCNSSAIGGVMISASHNPPEDNGIKFFGADGIKLPKALQDQIEAGLRGDAGVIHPNAKVVLNEAGHLIQDLKFTWGHHYQRSDLLRAYLSDLTQSIAQLEGFQEQPLAGLKVVLDLAWGAAVHLAPEAFRALGAEVICLHDQPDGDRINVNCGSTHLDQLQGAVQNHGADLGFAFDGDADRVLAVDAQGRCVNGDYILYFWGKTLRDHALLPADTIVSTVMANLGFERAWAHQGGQLLRTAVGDQHVHAEMLRTGAMLGGEQSGHILCRHYGISGDGLLTALHVAALVKQADCSLADLMDQSFQPYPQLLRNVRVVDRDRRCHWQDCDPLQRAIQDAEAAMGDAGRVLVRASGTEPLIRVMVEAADAVLAHHWCNVLVAAVETHLVAG